MSCDPALVQEAAVLHVRFMHPKYREAERVAQAILEEYLEPRGESEVLYRLVLEKVKEIGVKTEIPDVGNLVTKALLAKGIKVWQ